MPEALTTGQIIFHDKGVPQLMEPAPYEWTAAQRQAVAKARETHRLTSVRSGCWWHSVGESAEGNALLDTGQS